MTTPLRSCGERDASAGVPPIAKAPNAIAATVELIAAPS
jgi:hypothetical protein